MLISDWHFLCSIAFITFIIFGSVYSTYSSSCWNFNLFLHKLFLFWTKISRKKGQWHVSNTLRHCQNSHQNVKTDLVTFGTTTLVFFSKNRSFWPHLHFKTTKSIIFTNFSIMHYRATTRHMAEILNPLLFTFLK